MRVCKIDNEFVNCSLVGVDPHGFGRPLANENAISYSLKFSIEEVVNYFGGYYQEFIARESEDEGFEEDLKGLALHLKETGYLSLEKMFLEHSDLISKVLLYELPLEFMGYMFLDKCPALSKKYILQSLVDLKLIGNEVHCAGMAFINPAY